MDWGAVGHGCLPVPCPAGAWTQPGRKQSKACQCTAQAAVLCRNTESVPHLTCCPAGEAGLELVDNMDK